MRKKTAWSAPGWPWGLELVAFFFVLTAIAIPVYLQYIQTPDIEEVSLISRASSERMQTQGTWEDFTHFFWAVAIVGLYIAHFAMAGASSDWISTPFTHLFSPLVFSMITYYRLAKLGASSDMAIQVVTGDPGEIAMWVAGVMLITLLMARIRMSRHLSAFRDIEWEVESATLFDRTYFELLAYFRPLVYPPRYYKVCADGILIEGWLYVMPIPFEVIQTVDPVRRAHLMSSGYYLATSSRALVRIQVAEHREAIYISPKEREAFIHFCDERLGPRRVGTHAGETRSGARLAKATTATKHTTPDDITES